MEKLLRTISLILIGIIILVGYSFYFANEFYHSMVAEDGVFENITAVVLLLISVLFTIRLIKNRKTRNNYWIALNLFIILGSFFGFGEEISWGQRIFSIESGDFFMENNLQEETNLHNLEINGVKINKLIFSQGITLVLGIYFLFSLLLYKKVRFFRKQIDLWGIQIPKIKHTVIILICSALIQTVPDARIWELWETEFVLILLMVFLDPYNPKEKLLTGSQKNS